jgi:ribose transport system substrate-binding protein
MGQTTREGGFSRRGVLKGSAALIGTGVAGGLLQACGGSSADAPAVAAAAATTTAGSTAVALGQVTKGQSVGLIALDRNSPAVAVGVQAMNKIKDEVGWTVDVIDIAGDASKIPGAVSDLVSKEVDAIWAYALPGVAVGDAFAPAIKAKVPIISMISGRFPGAAHVIDFNEWVSEARTAMYVVQRMGFAGEIALLNFEDIEAAAIRGKVIRDVLARYKDIKIVEDLRVKVPGQLQDAHDKTAAFLGRHPKLKCVWGGWDELGLGANTAIKEAGRDDVFVASVDGIAPALEAIRNGDPFSATCFNDQDLVMRVATDVTDRLGKGQKLAQTTLTDSPFMSKATLPAKGQTPHGFVTPFWVG